MKRIGRMFVLAMVMAGLLLPGFTGTASAQDASLCDEALVVWQGSGTELGRYDIVEFTGGAGSQIVLGYGGATLSGGSGNDVLCAWGSGNVLDGGSGNDLLVAREGPVNTFRGGSGNDTMIGLEGDIFDGGSGRNDTVRHQPLPVSTFMVEWSTTTVGNHTLLSAVLNGTGLQPGAEITQTRTYSSGPSTGRTAYVDLNGNADHIVADGGHCDDLISIVFDTVDRNGNPIQTNEPVPCP